MGYSTLLFDLDHTLLDSDASEVAAFAEAVRSVGHEPSDDLFTCYQTINRALWARVEQGEITPVEVKVTRFEQLIDQADMGHGGIGSASAETMAKSFTAGLGNNGELYPGAREVLDQLAGRARLAMVTNGLSEVQRARIERLDLGGYFESVVISAEVGCSKPGTEIFDLVFEQLGHPERSDTLMIGDSLTSDIQGGTNYEIDTCWFNPHRQARPETTTARVTHEIDNLNRIPGFL
ncbi:MAG: YjjG family noncanonical pyrimidine nucleotidase [Acidimicrobiales bacterium]